MRVSWGQGRLRQGALVVIVPLGLFLTGGCNKQKPDFGTLPQVKVTFGRESPPQSPPPPAPPPPDEDVGLAPAKPSSDLPDPPPLRTDDYLYYTLVFDQGELRVEKVEPVHLQQPASSARRLGRFAFEFWVGKELLDRIRFDFPLLAAETGRGENEFERGLKAQTLVKVPRPERASSARVLDRKTRQIYPVEWPPSTSLSTPSP